MKVEKLVLRNFRNIEECSFFPDPKLNFLIGSNGQGKTAILEALSFLATLRSFRGAKSDEVIRWGEASADIACTLSARDEDISGGLSDWKTDLRLIFVRNEPKLSTTAGASKTAFINGKPYRSSTQYLSQRFTSFALGFHTIVFNPADHELVRGEPAIRRTYLDRVLAAEDLEYLKMLQRYQRTLEQRNALLKSDERVSRELLSGFTDPLSKYGSQVAYKRLEWIERLSKRLAETAHQIAPRQRPLRVIYASNWVPEISELSYKTNTLRHVHFAGQQHLASLELLEQAFRDRLAEIEETELRARSTLVGPHRDDWAFLIGDQFLKGHGSQGEIRSALLALKLCEIDLFRERAERRPLFLLDDFSSELDQERREYLLSFLSNTDLQVFITTTEGSFGIGKRYQVLNGTILNEEP